MDWAKKRRIIYGFIFAGALIALAAYPVYLVTNKAPTCSDGKQNGGESGVDCGGGCEFQCVAEMKAPRVVWAKALPLGGSMYDLGADIENLNLTAGVKSARYSIRVYGSDSSLLSERKGQVEIPPASAFLLFETGVSLSAEPSRTEVVFEPEDLTKWVQAKISPSVVLTKNKNITNTNTAPRFDAILVNTDPVNSVSSLIIGAVIYDTSRNPVAISRTTVDQIAPDGEQNIFFTWPNKFTESSQSFITEIIITPPAIFAH